VDARRRLLGVALVTSAVMFLLLLAGSSVAAIPRGALLGKLDLAAYCQRLGYTNVALRRGRVGSNHAYNNWVCVKRNGTQTPIIPSGRAPSMTDDCRFTYRGANALAAPRNANDASSWSCYRPAKRAVSGARR
jgi:hypothetical protein